jgi:CRP/FNR family transcriptional regulator, dissimilatory nitrate respiration regulator
MEQQSTFVETASLFALDLFKELPTSCLEALERDSRVESVETGHIFFQPGQRGQVLFLLEKGAVQTYRTSGRKKLIIADLSPPAVFGEMGCVGQGIYYCTAQAMEPSQIRIISKTQLESLQHKFPSVLDQLLELVSRRFAQVLLELEATSFQNLIPRIATLLLARAKRGLVKGITHKEIAEYLRVYRESATTALGELRKAGIIAIERKRIRIVDRARLERAAREQSSVRDARAPQEGLG